MVQLMYAGMAPIRHCFDDNAQCLIGSLAIQLPLYTYRHGRES